MTIIRTIGQAAVTMCAIVGALVIGSWLAQSVIGILVVITLALAVIADAWG